MKKVHAGKAGFMSPAACGERRDGIKITLPSAGKKITCLRCRKWMRRKKRADAHAAAVAARGE